MTDNDSKASAADHVHPSFHPDGTRIQIQSAMLSDDNRSMNICVVPLPDAWLQRTYDEGTHALGEVTELPVSNTAIPSHLE